MLTIRCPTVAYFNFVKFITEIFKHDLGKISQQLSDQEKITEIVFSRYDELFKKMKIEIEKNSKSQGQLHETEMRNSQKQLRDDSRILKLETMMEKIMVENELANRKFEFENKKIEKLICYKLGKKMKLNNRLSELLFYDHCIYYYRTTGPQ